MEIGGEGIGDGMEEVDLACHGAQPEGWGVWRVRVRVLVLVWVRVMAGFPDCFQVSPPKFSQNQPKNHQTV